ncbi:hypothetical protein M9Y10_004663 [Tritrichomonas musculus]|uniref:Glycosyltransferase family 92 protein n=1 Tax=Tritrichomonas musculus TaxID=1915356 RepID=A0ABR2JLS3_9EUKA
MFINAVYKTFKTNERHIYTFLVFCQIFLVHRNFQIIFLLYCLHADPNHLILDSIDMIFNDTYHLLTPKCTEDGFLEDHIALYKRFYRKDIPTIYEVLYDNGILTVIMALYAIHASNYTPITKKLDRAEWFCKPRGTNLIIKNTFKFHDGYFRHKILKFPISYEIIKQCNQSIHIFSPDVHLYYSNIPFCILPPPPPENKFPLAILCTEQLYSPRTEILDWIVWHLSQGFSHAIIYINDEKIEQMKSDLSDAIKKGFLKIVDWNWPRNSHVQDQVPSLMSCLYHNKRRTKWIGFNDIDESFVALNKNTVKDFLIANEHKRMSISALVAPNRFILTSQRFVKNPLCSVSFEPVPWRQKLIVVPDNTDSIAVHRVANGKKTWKSNELMNAHYKIKDVLKLYKKDTRLTNCSINMLDKEIEKFKKLVNYY